MTSLPELIPDVDFLLAMEAEELAATMLPILARGRQQSGVHLGNYSSSVFSPNMGGHLYDRRNEHQILLAVTEAWNWLEVHGLLVPAPGTNGSHGWRVFSRKAEKLTSSDDVRQFAKSRHLRREILNPRIADKVWSAFIRSEYDVAVFQAMKAVEVAVREASGFGAEELGVKLMRRAFNVENGPLTDMTAEMGERQACSDLFAGAIGSYKNSHSHRDVNLDNPDEAHELVMLANHLLRIVDQRRAAV
ncbi:TIGR02391 family protein [Bradyrhizobium sp. MOS002]|uniref:TIGR02391 family protein n=1 Tax=Bradyrhizobium sp. MOS002 TaxID=2133947 RepID=UPI000D117FEB|nr:TIGR02391 family protein [Bradyrhizobium sp. MOS002]PSO25205.1 TIGR02391 family protein [Bradyrhizobium sp. MOS002]